MIITVTMNPAIDKTALIKKFTVGGLNRLTNPISDMGGKGINVSKAIKALGGESLCTGFIAGENGQWIIQQLENMNIQHDFIKVEGNTRVNLKILDESMTLTELNEVGQKISKEDLELLIHKLNKLTQKDDIVILAGSVPLGIKHDIYAKMINDLKKKEVKVILDADGDLFKEGIEACPFLIKPNKYELCQYFNLNQNCSNDELIEKAKTLLTKGIQVIVISLGSKGAIFLTNHQTIFVKGINVKAHSAVGAGDSMVGAIAYGLSQNFDLDPLIRLAVATSAGAVMSEGTKPPTRDVVDSLVSLVKIESI